MSRFDQDLLYSLGAFMTICRITRNNGEQRIRAIGSNSAAPPVLQSSRPTVEPEPEEGGVVDLGDVARQEIAQRLIRKFKGHDLARLVGAILRAQGYSVHVSPPGADRGVDILAAPGALGFGSPRLCVQVKSSDGPCDSETLMKLGGSMTHVGADQGLLVSWGGFKSSIRGDLERSKFFSIRLWGQDELIEALLGCYQLLDPEIKAELPLKQIWTIAHGEDGL